MSTIAKRPVVLLRVEEARALLAKCVRIDEAKSIRDKAEAIKIYLRQQNASRDAQNDAAEIKLRAERRLGELLVEQKAKGERHSGRGNNKKKLKSHAATPTSVATTLKELGIEKHSAARWQVVANVPEAKFEAFIKKERDGGEITTAGLTHEAKQLDKARKRAAQVKQTEAYKFPPGQYPVIVADWPWKYNDALDGQNMERGIPYPPQTVEEICASIDKLPVADDCALFAWVTNSILLDPAWWPVVAAKLFERWGFVAKQIRTWVKTGDEGQEITGQGWVWRNDTEHLIRLERGRPVFRPMGAAHGVPIQRTSFEAPIGEHSEKPQKAYDDIAAICAATLLLELHSRKPRKGWVTSGAEMPDAPPAQVGPVQTSSGPRGAALVPHPTDVSASPVNGGALSDRSDTRREKNAKIAAEYQQLAAPKVYEPGLGKKEFLEHEALGAAGLLPSEYECLTYHQTFVSLEVFRKHGKACGEAVPLIEAIAGGAAQIESDVELTMATDEVKRLDKISLQDVNETMRTISLNAAIEDYEKRRAPKEKAIGFVPPADPVSLKPVEDDGIDF